MCPFSRRVTTSDHWQDLNATSPATRTFHSFSPPPFSRRLPFSLPHGPSVSDNKGGRPLKVSTATLNRKRYTPTIRLDSRFPLLFNRTPFPILFRDIRFETTAVSISPGLSNSKSFVPARRTIWRAMNDNAPPLRLNRGDKKRRPGTFANIRSDRFASVACRLAELRHIY